MPRSRKRRTRRSRATRSHTPARRDELDELQPWLAVMVAADAAEARGDAGAALQHLATRPEGPDGKPFWRPWRVEYLSQLTMYEEHLPRWATSRWILAQALQRQDRASRPRVHRALQIAIDLRGGEDKLTGVDRVDARCQVMDHDWVYRQVFLYELGGLNHFLGKVASADLVAGADRIRDWAGASMGGYRLLKQDSRTVTWQSKSTGELVEVSNIGSAALVEPGEHVIGRLVPIGGGSMFEAAPLVVPEPVAQRVSDDPSAWLNALSEVGAGEIATAGHHFGLVTDVPPIIWQAMVLRGSPLPQSGEIIPDQQLVDGTLGLARLALTRGSTADGARDVSPWPCLAAALLEPVVTSRLADSIQPGDEKLLRELGDRLAEPASAVCHELAGCRPEAA